MKTNRHETKTHEIRVQVSTHLSPALAAEVDAVCRAEDLPRSRVIAHLLRTGLDARRPAGGSDPTRT